MDEKDKMPEPTNASESAAAQPSAAEQAQATESTATPGATDTQPAQPAQAVPEATQPVQPAQSAQPVPEQTQPMPAPVSEPVYGQVQGAPAGQTPPPPTEPMPSAAPFATVPTPDASNAAGYVPSATPALICGILAILFCGIPIVGIILGIVAIVLAGKHIKAGGTDGSGKAGKICGIVGIVLSAIMIVVSTIMIIVGLTVLEDNDVDVASISISEDYPAYSSSAATSSGDIAVREEINDVVVARLDQIKDADPTMMASLEAIAASSFESVFASNDMGMTMENCGVDPATYISLMATDFDYSLIDIDETGNEEGDTAEANYYLTMRSIMDVVDNFNDALNDAQAAGAFAGLSEDEIRAEWGRMFMQAVEDADITESNYLEMELTKTNGAWVIDEDQWQDEMEYFFGLE